MPKPKTSRTMLLGEPGPDERSYSRMVLAYFDPLVAEFENDSGR